MKSLARWSATLGLIGSVMLGSFFGGNLGAFALSEEEIVEKLGLIPVFSITNTEGVPISLSMSVANPENNANQDSQNFIAFFMSQDDAQAALENIRKGSPELAETLRTQPIPLARAYQIIKASQQQEQAPPFVFFPEQQQLQNAVSLLQQQGQPTQQVRIDSVPLFYVGSSQDDSLVFFQRGEEEGKVLLFFDKDQAQNFLENSRQQQQNSIDSNFVIKVGFLDALIDRFQNSDEEVLKKIVLVPSPESEQFLREEVIPLIQQQQNSQPSSGSGAN